VPQQSSLTTQERFNPFGYATRKPPASARAFHPYDDSACSAVPNAPCSITTSGTLFEGSTVDGR
jgi:hypothetical protein